MTDRRPIVCPICTLEVAGEVLAPTTVDPTTGMHRATLVAVDRHTQPNTRTVCPGQDLVMVIR